MTRLYLMSWAALQLLLGVEVVTALLLPAWGSWIVPVFPIAMAVIVIWILMKVRSSAPLVRVACAAGFFWLAVLLALSQTDYLSRAHHPTRDYESSSEQN